MTELSGTLEGVGLPAIVRFLTGLKKTGSLRIVHNDWRGEIFFDVGQVTGASLGSRQGLTALDALVQALPGGSFTFDSLFPAAAEANISLSAEALQAHLDDLASQTANGRPRLPSFDAVPVMVDQDDSSSGEEPLTLDRGTLQTLLAVDGRRTVQEIVAQRGSLDALWQLAHLVEMGLVRMSGHGTAAPAEVMPAALQAAPAEVTTSPPRAGLDQATPGAAATPYVVLPSVEPIAVEPERIPPTIARPFAMDVVAAPDVNVHCPKLGFEDDPSNAFGRPTRMHRCFAAGTPLPLSLDQQRELCLSDQFGTCPRLTMGGFVPPARDPQSARDMSTLRQSGPGSRRPEPEADDPRIVRLPLVARANAAERGAIADRQAVGGAEPTRFRSAGSPAHEGASTSSTRSTPSTPTPLRARLERANGDGALAEPRAVSTREPVAPDSKSVRQASAIDFVERRVRGIPVLVIAGGALMLVVLAVLTYLLVPRLGDVFVDDTMDPSKLPNASAVSAGTPIAQLIKPRATPVARASSAATGTDAIAAPDTGDAAASKPAPGAASAASASTAAPAPTLPPEPGQAAPKPAAGAPQPAAAPAGAAQSAAGTLLDERFTNNDRNWPSTPQGTAFLSNGSYRLAPRQAGQFVAVGAPIADALKDVVINATFHKLSGPLGGGYGIIVRDQALAPQNGTGQDGHYYVLEVGDKGEVGMWQRDGDQWIDLLPWQPNAAVKPDTASNDLLVRAVGNRLSLTVNGTLVAAKTDDTFAAGGVGVFAGGDGNQVAVDRFSIQTP